MKQLKTIAILIMMVFIVGIANPAMAHADETCSISRSTPTLLTQGEACYFNLETTAIGKVSLIAVDPNSSNLGHASITNVPELIQPRTYASNPCHQPNLQVYPSSPLQILCVGNDMTRNKWYAVTNTGTDSSPDIHVVVRVANLPEIEQEEKPDAP